MGLLVFSREIMMRIKCIDENTVPRMFAGHGGGGVTGG